MLEITVLGKSNALRIFDQLGYRPLFDTSITPANIYNFLGRYEEGQGIILEDEIDYIEKQEEESYIRRKYLQTFDRATGC